MTFDGGQVPACDRTSERRDWSEPADVLKSALGKRQECLEGKSDGRGHALNLAEERDEVIGCHAGRGVVAGPCLRRDQEGTAPERQDEVGDGLVAQPRRNTRRSQGARLR